MKFDTFLQVIGKRGWFDLPTVVQMVDEPRGQLKMQLCRWHKAGKLLLLRRGMYALAEEYRRADIQPAELANHIYSPSCLSLQWALSYYGLIPEMTVLYTSVSTRQTKRFQNDFGAFAYRRLKPGVFFGYRRVEMDGHGIMMAEPEKALLDFWYLEPGRWKEERMLEMRFQNVEILNMERLAKFANIWAMPKLDEAVQTFKNVVIAETEGAVEL